VTVGRQLALDDRRAAVHHRPEERGNRSDQALDLGLLRRSPISRRQKGGAKAIKVVGCADYIDGSNAAGRLTNVI
jgi:hypothetical protein